MKTLRFLFYLTGIGLMLTMPAFAYVDPSVTTFAFQAIVAVVVVAGAVIGVAWRKAKKKAMQVLNIDENAKKTVEDDLVITEDAGEPAAPAEEEARTAEAETEPAAEAAAGEETVGAAE